MRRPWFRFWLLVLLIVLIVLVVFVAYYVIADRDTPLTTDAYVQAYVVRVAPQVSGLVVRVHVASGRGAPSARGTFSSSWTTARSSTRWRCWRPSSSPRAGR